jgi:hypothetical protein
LRREGGSAIAIVAHEVGAGCADLLSRDDAVRIWKREEAFYDWSIL